VTDHDPNTVFSVLNANLQQMRTGVNELDAGLEKAVRNLAKLKEAMEQALGPLDRQPAIPGVFDGKDGIT
jgi:hypothetical protein